jgi:subtilisin family serine protease
VIGQGWNSSSCNRKIIGAKFYSKGANKEHLKVDYLSARDYGGHGTHTASTAAGSVVEAASFHGLAAGTARGGAPRARIAVYKPMWGPGTASGSSADILEAVDDAIHDGVDVLSLSIGGGFPDDSFATLHAVQKGITVVFSGGNAGPSPQTVENTAPWVITVAASTMDRSFPTVITLGNKQQITVQNTNTAQNSKCYILKKLIICTELIRSDRSWETHLPILICRDNLSTTTGRTHPGAFSEIWTLGESTLIH